MTLHIPRSANNMCANIKSVSPLRALYSSLLSLHLIFYGVLLFVRNIKQNIWFRFLLCGTINVKKSEGSFGERSEGQMLHFQLNGGVRHKEFGYFLMETRSLCLIRGLVDEFRKQTSDRHFIYGSEEMLCSIKCKPQSNAKH